MDNASRYLNTITPKPRAPWPNTDRLTHSYTIRYILRPVTGRVLVDAAHNLRAIWLLRVTLPVFVKEMSFIATRTGAINNCYCRHCDGRFQELRHEWVQMLQESVCAGIPTVFILTFCRKMDLFYGTSLVFKTLRTGFPNARVVVVDNASVPSAREEISALARQTGCRHYQIEEPDLDHPEFIELALSAFAASHGGDGTLVFLDPDVCFWESCEGFHFDGLMAGRLLRSYECEAIETANMPRLHTSFLWIPSGRQLWQAIRDLRSQHYDFSPFATWTTKIAGRWHRYDTGCSLYAALGEHMNAFQEEHLRRFDHIFCGSHIDWLEDVLDPETLAIFKQAHAHAREGNLEALRGIGNLQETVWRNLKPQRVATPGPAVVSSL